MGKTYFYVTDDIENGNWHVSTTDKCYDLGLLFDDNGKEVKKYVLHPADTFDDHAMYLREMKVDKDWNVTVSERRKVIDYANLENPARGLRAEGYHGYKIGDYYYIFMIQGCDGQRQEIVWRSRDLFNGKEWKTIGDTLQMYYDWPDFCGYRFALFHYATKEAGGVADFDWFHVK